MLFSPDTRKDFQILLFYSYILVILDILINRIYYYVNSLRPQPRKICGWYHESAHKKKHIPFIFKDAEARKYRPPLTRGPEVSLCDLNSTNHWILLTWNQKKTSMKRN